jgi:hypothetical protein
MAAIPNLGYPYPWGYASNLQGVRGILNHSKISLQKLNKSGFGGYAKGSSLIWGYVKGVSFDLGVREQQKVENP